MRAPSAANVDGKRRGGLFAREDHLAGHRGLGHQRSVLAQRSTRGHPLGPTPVAVRREEGFSVASMLIAARTRAHLTQAELAEKMGTSQSMIARLESGAAKPTLSTL